jgi:hypothetical protein
MPDIDHDPIFYDPRPLVRPGFRRTYNLPVSFDHDPPKPMKAAQIAHVGDLLDTIEKITTIWHPDRADYERRYRLALRDRVWYELARFAKVKRVPNMRDGQRLRDEMINAWVKLYRLEEAQSLGVCTMREMCDARAAYALADSKFQIAQKKFRTGITRPGGYGTKGRTITNGYVKTGKYKMIDGVRVPVVEKVE